MNPMKAKHLYIMAYVLFGTGSLVMVIGLLEWALEGKTFSWVGMGSIWMGVIALVVANKKANELGRIPDEEETREDS